jgi:hypothetical protein
MTALATSADVVAVLGRALTAAETAKVDASLAKASTTARRLTGRLYEAGTYTVERKVRQGRPVNLDDAATVTLVNAINCDGTATELTGYTLRGSRLYGLTAINVEVTYTTTGGVPQDVVDVVASMAARDLTNDVPGGATSYSVTKGPFSESASFDSPTEAIEPEPTEAATLARYALRRSGPISSL